jgi:hypothetical protein
MGKFAGAFRLRLVTPTTTLDEASTLADWEIG